MSERNNEAAFPVVHPDGLGVQYYGLSIRDYFAAMALNGVMANKDRPTYFMPEDYAAYMYKIADAMLAEREREQ